MQVSIIMYQDLNHEFRIDAEYYRRDIVDKIDVLERHNKDYLKNLVDFVIGPFGSTVRVEQYVNNSEFRYIRNKDINDFVIKDSDPALITHDIFNSLSKYHIKKNDLLITVVGTLGKVAIAREADIKSIFSCKSTILRVKHINPFYLLVYLNTDTGKLFSTRGKRGAIQEGLNLTDLREIQIFIPSVSFQENIEEMAKDSFLKIKKSNLLYEEAQSILLSHLGLADWQPEHQLTFVKNYTDIQQAERMDAEYFQPKYDDIVNAIKNYSGGWDELGSLVHVKKCVEVGSDEYMDEGIPFVRVSNLSPFEITEEKYISETLYKTLIVHQPRQGEILFSKDATPGIAHHLKEVPKKMIPSGGILCLKMRSDKVNHEYFTLVLNSILTQEQVKRDVGGSVILHWRPDQIERVIIPILPRRKQSQIQQKVIKSFNLRKQSKQLLEFAKKAVEMAIEKDEQKAMKWLQNKTKEIQTK